MTAQQYAEFWLPYAVGFATANFILLLLLLVLVIALWKTLTVQTRQNAALVLTTLHGAYSTGEMYDAIQTVLDWTQPEFDKDSRRQKHRRMVLHFWEFIGTLVRFEVIKEELLRDRFRDQISIWEKVLPIQTRVQEKIIRERQPNLADGEITTLATREVETSSAHWLYLKWKDSRRPTWRSRDD